MDSPASSSDPISLLHPAAIWGVLGFIAILASAVYRLTPLALEPIRLGGLQPWHYALYAASIVFNVYSEGYRAFHLQVAPRVVARAQALAERKRFWLIAPLFCMSLVHATRRRLIITWSIYVALVIVIIAVRQIPQPYRGVIDAGVVVALSFGVLSILYFFVRGVQGHVPPASSDLPAS